MLKVLAVLRTVFLLFILGYTLRTLPWGWTRTFDEEFARCTATRALAIQAVWIAIAWITFETVVGWWLVRRSARKALEAGSPKPGTSEPPFAPPPHR
jgi:hypothetical protein